MSDIKREIELYKLDIKKLINIEPKQFEVAQVAHMVTAIPERKWNSAQAVVNGTIAFKNAKNNLKTVKAKKQLEANANKERFSSADDRKAYSETHVDTQRAEIELIDAEAELLSAKLAYECLDDLFTAGKKIMDYLGRQEQATREYERYAND